MVRTHDAALKPEGSKVEITHYIKECTAYIKKLRYKTSVHPCSSCHHCEVR